MFSSSRFELPKQRKFITRYLLPDVSTQPNVLIFKGCNIQEDYLLEMKTWPKHCLKTARTKYPSGAALHPTFPLQRNHKNLQILWNFTIFYTKKYWIYNRKITRCKPEILTWNEGNTQTGLVSEMQIHGPIRNKRFATAMTRTALFQCKAPGRGSAGRSKATRMPITTRHQTTDRTQPCIFCSSQQTERIPRLDLFLCNDATFLIPIN
jgi:hypothetical protein